MTHRRIRATFTEAEAEALLASPGDKRVDPLVRLRARGKLTSALLADLTYQPPNLRVGEGEQPE